MVTRNPSWSRDELIVALDFYLTHPSSIPGKNSKEILELSSFLNALKSKVGGEISETFRNANGVYMKLMNFRRFDPSSTGVGLQRGNKDEEVVWNLYSSKPQDLHKVAAAIRSFVTSDFLNAPGDLETDDTESGEEGQLLTRVHRYRERDPKLVKRKKDRVLAELGSLSCEVCSFDFGKSYQKHGEGFIECHHTKPLSELGVGGVTNLSDLALVCSNCHRMIHRKRPWLSIEGLKSFLRS